MTKVQCRCGATEIEITAEPIVQFFCHCNDCRAVHGGAYAPESVYPADAVKVVRGDPGDFEARYNLALALANAGRLAEGATEIQAILRQKPGWAPAFFGLGHIQVMQGSATLAEQSFRTAIRLDPNLVRAHFELGKLLDQGGDREGAIRELEAAIRLDPQLAAARYRLARVLQQAGQPERSAAELAKMREVSEQRAKGEQAALAYQQGLDRMGREDFDGAIADLERAVRLRPDFIEIRPALAEACRRWGALLENRGPGRGGLPVLRHDDAVPAAGGGLRQGPVLAAIGRGGAVHEAVSAVCRPRHTAPQGPAGRMRRARVRVALRAERSPVRRQAPARVRRRWGRCSG